MAYPYFRCLYMSITIIAGIIIIVSALVCYAYISQSIEKKRIQKQRILMALKTKQRNLLHLAAGFPAGFLSPDLQSTIFKAMVETVEQLANLEPQDPRHQDDITLYSNQLATLSKQNNPAQRPRLDNPQQMKEVRTHLKELESFIGLQEQGKSINKVQADAFRDQLKRLNLQMGVDAYLYHAKQAQQASKWRLALHFFGLAKKMLAAENSAHTYDKQIAQISSIIIKLEEKAQITPEVETSNKQTPDAAKEWDNFEPQKEDSWKKKQVYD